MRFFLHEPLMLMLAYALVPGLDVGPLKRWTLGLHCMRRETGIVGLAGRGSVLYPLQLVGHISIHILLAMVVAFPHIGERPRGWS